MGYISRIKREGVRKSRDHKGTDLNDRLTKFYENTTICFDAHLCYKYGGEVGGLNAINSISENICFGLKGGQVNFWGQVWKIFAVKCLK